MKGLLIVTVNIHLVRIKISPGDLVPSVAKSTHSDLHHHISGLRLALRMAACHMGGAESLNNFHGGPIDSK